ncbi:MAG: TrmH family RNA methyltransferase, partial [Tepidisphaeraceae bacterium]
GGLFIAEGAQVVTRLLRSRFALHSILAAEHRVELVTPLVALDVPIYVVSREVMNSVIGFKFHSGLLACARRSERRGIDELIRTVGKSLTLVACPEVTNTENLGGLIRIAAGLGADGIVLGERCCDPFFRRTIRVSMGAVFSLPIYQCDDIRADLHRLRRQLGVELIATVLDESALPLDRCIRKDRMAILFGNEAQGLPEALMEICDRRVTIPMKLGTDSLNVAVSAGIVLYHFRR